LLLLAIFLIILYPTGIPTLTYLRIKDYLYPYTKEGKLREATLNGTLALKLSTGAVLYDVLIDSQIYAQALGYVLLEKGKDYYKKGYTKEAMAYYDRTIKMDPKLMIFILQDVLENIDKSLISKYQK